MSIAFARALLVEDEPNLAEALRIALRKLGVEAIHVSTLKDARLSVRAVEPEFILLDRTLPDGDGLELCRELRERGFTGIILMLTAAGRLNDRVEGLSAGADDYLPKPFSWEELNARIVALSRARERLLHRHVAPPPSQASGPVALWTREDSRLRVLGPLGWVDLTPLEYKLACHLFAAAGGIVGRSELLKRVWGFTLLPKTRTVDHFMGRLRKMFELDPDKPVHFLTVRGAGYRFEK